MKKSESQAGVLAGSEKNNWHFEVMHQQFYPLISNSL